MNEDKYLIFFEDFKKRNKKRDDKKSKQALDLEHLKGLIDKGLYKPDFDKIAELFIEEEFKGNSPRLNDQDLDDNKPR